MPIKIVEKNIGKDLVVLGAFLMVTGLLQSPRSPRRFVSGGIAIWVGTSGLMDKGGPTWLRPGFTHGH